MGCWCPSSWVMGGGAGPIAVTWLNGPSTYTVDIAPCLLARGQRGTWGRHPVLWCASCRGPSWEFLPKHTPVTDGRNANGNKSTCPLLPELEKYQAFYVAFNQCPAFHHMKCVHHMSLFCFQVAPGCWAVSISHFSLPWSVSGCTVCVFKKEKVDGKGKKSWCEK